MANADIQITIKRAWGYYAFLFLIKVKATWLIKQFHNSKIPVATLDFGCKQSKIMAKDITPLILKGQ